MAELGWTPPFQEHFSRFKERNERHFRCTYFAGRVVSVHKTSCRVLTESGEIQAAISANIPTF